MVAVPVITEPAPPPAAPGAPLGGVPLPTPTVADPLSSIIASSGRWAAAALGNVAHTLPIPGDDLERDFGTDLYTRIGRHPQVSSATNVYVKAVLNCEALVQPSVAKDHPAYDLSRRMAVFGQTNFAALRRPLLLTLAEMLRGALQHGHKLGELIYRVDTLDPALGPQLVLDRIACKPFTAYAFVQDGYGTPLGLVAQRPGLPLVTSTVYVGGKDGWGQLYDLTKFAILTHDGVNSDPRGTSAYQTIYNPWYMITQILPELLSYIARFGQPTVIATNAPNAQEIPQGTPAAPTAPVNPNQALLNAAIQLRAGGVVALSPGQLMQLLEAAGNGEVFFAALKLFTDEITKGLLGATLATSEGQHRSGKDAATHQDVVGITVRFAKAWMADFVRQEILAPLCEYNFGPQARAVLPTVSLGQFDPHDLPALANAMAQLANAHYWDPAVVPQPVGMRLDERLNMPVRPDPPDPALLAAPAAPPSATPPPVPPPAAGGGTRP